MIGDDAPGIWSELRAQRDLLIEMKTKLDAVPDHENRIRKLEEFKPEVVPDLQNRIRSLEERRFPLQIVGTLVALGALAVAAVSLISQFI
ncbi:hypothetical protein [Streptomyces sp. NPDC001774]